MSAAEHDLLKDFANLSMLLLGVGMLVSLVAARVLPGGLTQRYGKINAEKLGTAELAVALGFLALLWWKVIGDVPRPEGERAMRPSDFMASAIVQLAFLFGVVYFLGRIRGHDLVEFFGWTKLPAKKVLIWGVTLGISGFILANLLGSLIEALIFKDHLEKLQPQQAVRDIVKNRQDVSYMFSVFISACVIAPVMEETLFRGFLYPALKRFTLPIVAAVVVSGIFAAFHSNLYALVPLAFLAIMLTAAYEATGSLWVPITAHAVFNLCNVLATIARPEL